MMRAPWPGPPACPHYHVVVVWWLSLLQLMTKNVASEIAHQICDSVRTSLIGQKLPSLTR